MRRRPSAQGVRKGVTAEVCILFTKKPLRRTDMRRFLLIGFALTLLGCAGKENKVVYLDEEGESRWKMKKVSEVCDEDGEFITCKEVYIKPVPVQKESLYEKERKEVLLDLIKNVPAPIRTPDTVLKVYLLPYTDGEGNFYGGGYFFMVVEDGRWLLGGEGEREIKLRKVLTPLKKEGKDGSK